jgi:hypothetical protein
MQRPAFVSLVVASLVTLACTKAADTKAATDSSAAAAAAAMAPKPVTLADFAGTWAMKSWNEKRDSVLVESELMATADTTSWMVHLPNRPPLSGKIVAMGGDSVVVEVAPYESVLRKGVKVSTHTVYHLMDGKLMGTTTAHYTTKGADSVRMLPTEGTRKP